MEYKENKKFCLTKLSVKNIHSSVEVVGPMVVERDRKFDHIYKDEGKTALLVPRK